MSTAISILKFLSIAVIVIAVVCLAFGAINGNCESSNIVSSAESAVLMEATSHRVLLSKNSDRRLPMASTTKIMTALVVSENCNMSEIVTIPREAVGVEGSSIYLREGEQLTVKELLYGLMLQSGNDSAVALALHVAGSVDKFAEKMNLKAQEIGAENSHFENPHGLSSENHFTTAYDLALITSCALENKDVAEIVATKSVTIEENTQQYGRYLKNKNKLLFNYEYATGVKTGYTKKAGRCFVGSSEKDGMKLIAVVLNCAPMFETAQKMLEYGNSYYNMTVIIPQNKIYKATNGGLIDKYYSADAFLFPLRNDGSEYNAIKINSTFNDEGGCLQVLFDNESIYSKPLKAI
ncbi:MAG: D-alanyl-D-alanine carboxypeptidase [Corallococcus sp.]|nr:D-alanyl-D-alanine carboxypeptidase [Corallococcus sp.]